MTIKEAVRKVNNYNKMCSELNIDSEEKQLALRVDYQTWEFKKYFQLERKLFNEYVDCLANAILARDDYEVDHTVIVEAYDADWDIKYKVCVTLYVTDIY